MPGLRLAVAYTGNFTDSPLQPPASSDGGLGFVLPRRSLTLHSDPKLVLAQLGCGYWGPNLLRNFSSLPNCLVKYVVDSSPVVARFVETQSSLTPGALESAADVLADPEVRKAVVIATPANTHFNLARQVLAAGKHVFVEKPLATKVSEVDELARCARSATSSS